MNNEISERLQAAVYQVIETQIAELDPPETKRTRDRLISEGYSEEETMKLIGGAVVSEIFDVLKEGKPYEEQRYVAALKALPTLPWDR